MTVFLLSLLIVGLVVGGMAIGVLMGRAPIKGSCGGIGALGIQTSCEICGGNPQRCEEEPRERRPGPAGATLYDPSGD